MLVGDTTTKACSVSIDKNLCSLTRYQQVEIRTMLVGDTTTKACSVSIDKNLCRLTRRFKTGMAIVQGKVTRTGTDTAVILHTHFGQRQNPHRIH